MKHIFFFFYFLFLSFISYSGVVEWTSRLDGSSIIGGSLRMVDGDYIDLGTGKFKDRLGSDFGYLRLGFGERLGMDYVGEDIRVNVDVRIIPNGLPSFTQSLEVSYFGGSGQQGVSIDGTDLRMPGTHKFNVEVLTVSVYRGSSTVPSTNLPSYAYLEAGFSSERYYAMDEHATSQLHVSYITFEYLTGTETVTPVTNLYTPTTAMTNEIELSWDYIPGAEYYDLEWSWVDNYSTDMVNSGVLTRDEISLTLRDFEMNSTRVRLSGQKYRIPNTFSKGYLIYRVRGVGIFLEDPELRKYKYSQWTGNSTTTTVNNWPDCIEIGWEHEQYKNWQYQATYAEDGKKKEVVQYFDGSLRGRQTVTRINSTNQTVVGETVYDNEGRGVIQILPVPQKNPSIQYYPQLNKGGLTGSSPYSFEHFDLEAKPSGTGTSSPSCVSVKPDILYPGSGAGQYYSTSAHQGDQDWQKNVPDAQGYAFTQIEYTPDNTGRIRNQSGVGTDHTIGSGHETYYYYAQSSQEELDRLFGYKIGNNVHYKKNMVVDANGQVSVSYLDARGKVVATALAGDNTTTALSSLSSESSSASTLSRDLLSKVQDSAPDTPNDLNILGSTGRVDGLEDKLSVRTTIPVTKDQTKYEVSYTVKGSEYTEPVCEDMTTPLHFPYAYDLKISIDNECGQAWGVTETKLDVSQLKTYSTPSQGVFLNHGTYTISKELQINEATYQEHLKLYLDSTNNPCLKTVDDFKSTVITDCESSCSKCLQDLGTEEKYIATSFQSLGRSTSVMTDEEISSYTQTYQEMYANLKKMCILPCEPISSCESMWGKLREDMKPGGQYGSVVTDATTGLVTDVLSIYNESNHLPINWQRDFNSIGYNLKSPNNFTHWRSVVYKDKNHKEVKIPVQKTLLSNTSATPNYIWRPKFDESKEPNVESTLDSEGNYWISPTSMAIEEFGKLQIDVSWIDTLVPFHPEYAIYEYYKPMCELKHPLQTIAFSANTTVNISSDTYDSYVRDQANTFDKAQGNGVELFLKGEIYKLDLINGLSSNDLLYGPIYSHDPFFKLTYDVHQVGQIKSNTLRKVEYMQYALTTNYKNNMPMLKFVTRMVMGGNDPNVAIPGFDYSWSSFITEAKKPSSSIFTKKQIDQIWSLYISNYLSLKAQLHQLFSDMYAANKEVGIYNASIGKTTETHLGIMPSFSKYKGSSSSTYGPFTTLNSYTTLLMDNFLMWEYNKEKSPPYNYLPLILGAKEYDDKEMRMTRVDGGDKSNASTPEDVLLQELTQEADYTMWKEKGKCPSLLDMDAFLSQMATEDKLRPTSSTTPAIDWNALPTMSPDLISALLGQPHVLTSDIIATLTDLQSQPPYTKSLVSVQTHLDGNSLAIELHHPVTSLITAPSPTPIATIAQVGDLDWSSYGTSWHIYYLGDSYVSTTNSTDELVLIRAGATEETAKEYVVSIHTSISLNGCNYEDSKYTANDARCTKKKDFEKAMLRLIRKLSEEGKMGQEVVLAGYPEYSNTILKDYFGQGAKWSVANGSTTIINSTENRLFSFNTLLPSETMYSSFNIASPESLQYTLTGISLGDSLVHLFPDEYTLKGQYESQPGRFLNFDCSCEEMTTGVMVGPIHVDTTPTVGSQEECKENYSSEVIKLFNEGFAKYAREQYAWSEFNYVSSELNSTKFLVQNKLSYQDNARVGLWTYDGFLYGLSWSSDGNTSRLNSDCNIQFSRTTDSLVYNELWTMTSYIPHENGTFTAMINGVTVEGTYTCSIQACKIETPCTNKLDVALKGVLNDLFQEAIATNEITDIGDFGSMPNFYKDLTSVAAVMLAQSSIFQTRIGYDNVYGIIRESSIDTVKQVFLSLNPQDCEFILNLTRSNLSDIAAGDATNIVVSSVNLDSPTTFTASINGITVHGTRTCQQAPCIDLTSSSCRKEYDAALQKVFQNVITLGQQGDLISTTQVSGLRELQPFLRDLRNSSFIQMNFLQTNFIPLETSTCTSSSFLKVPSGLIQFCLLPWDYFYNRHFDSPLVPAPMPFDCTCTYRLEIPKDARSQALINTFCEWTITSLTSIDDTHFKVVINNQLELVGTSSCPIIPCVPPPPCHTEFEIALKGVYQDVFTRAQHGENLSNDFFVSESLKSLQPFVAPNANSIKLNLNYTIRATENVNCSGLLQLKNRLLFCLNESTDPWPTPNNGSSWNFDSPMLPSPSPIPLPFDLSDFCAGCYFMLDFPQDTVTINVIKDFCEWTVTSLVMTDETHFDMVINGLVTLKGSLTCPIQCPTVSTSCDDCRPELLVPVSCTDTYERYHTRMLALKATITNTSDADDLQILTEDDFCAKRYGYISDAYLHYLTTMGVDAIPNNYFLFIGEFLSTPLGYSKGELVSAVNAYSYYMNDPYSPRLLFPAWVSDVYLKNKKLCPSIPPDVHWPGITIDIPCDQWAQNISTVNAKNQYASYMKGVINTFRKQYVAGAMSSVVETFEEVHADKEYHYTLYYYDRAGNLTQTVPPKGVDRLTLSKTEETAIKLVRKNEPDRMDEDPSVAPNHTMQTDYRYNSLNQLVYQNTPDGGESRFAYDGLGRLVVSQNAKQRANTGVNFGIDTYNPSPNSGDLWNNIPTWEEPQPFNKSKYSYTYYDDLGRVIEVGEFTDNYHQLMIDAIGRVVYRSDTTKLFELGKGDWLSVAPPSHSAFNLDPAFSREQVTRTIYDELKQLDPSTTTPTTYVDVTLKTTPTNTVSVASQFGVEYPTAYKYNTRNRIVGVVYQSVYNKDVSVHDNGTFYAYDVHGNVKELLQVNNDANLLTLGQTIKHFDYEYNLVSGNVNKVYYQKGEKDQYVHRYHYDADNRITHAETSKDDVRFEKDAKYFYYAHGPLARTEIGDKKVQAEDYAYTIQGWLKTVNGEQVFSKNMLGDDGLQANEQTTTSTPLNKMVGKDAFGFSLNYFNNDYQSANTAMLEYSNKGGVTYEKQHGLGLYNGNIRSMYTAISNNGENMPTIPSLPLQTHQTVYNYDVLNRIKSMNGYYRTGTETALTPSEYNSTYSYDANGNIVSMTNFAKADDGTKKQMDAFSYNYLANTNQLLSVDDDNLLTNNFSGDVDDQQTSNYGYDEIGQLIKDEAEKIEQITWTVTNKVKEVIYKGDLQGKKIRFDYDAMGHRIAKHVTSITGDVSSTYYVLDAQGNAMSTYTLTTKSESTFANKLVLSERNIYGSKRLGIEQLSKIVAEPGIVFTDVPWEQEGPWDFPWGNAPWEPIRWSRYYEDWSWTRNQPTVTIHAYKQEIGDKRYELANHLGNVLNVVTDRKLPVDIPLIAGTQHGDGVVDYFTSDVVSYSDYLCFGQIMPNRHGSEGSYRYGFNGKERLDEMEGDGNVYDFGARLLDVRLGRWMSRDALESKYPMDSPYQFAGNSTLVVIDPDGNEKIIITGSENRTWNLTFVISSMKKIRQYTRDKDSEGKLKEPVTMLLFKANYSEKQINRIAKFAAKNGATLQLVNSADEVVNYINTKSTTGKPSGRESDKVTLMSIFAHGLPNQIAFGYHQGEDIEKNYVFDKTKVEKLDPNAFESGAICRSYACRTGAGNDGDGNVSPESSLAQSLADKTGITVVALQKRSDYEGILPSDSRSFLQKAKEAIGLSKGDTTYDKNGGKWDTNDAIDKTSLPKSGDTPSSSPGWTIFKKNTKPAVIK